MDFISKIQMLRAAREEVTNVKGRVASDVMKESILSGYVYIPQYDPEKGRIQIATACWANSCSYLLTSRGAFLHGDEATPVTEPEALEKCRKLVQVVARHNPQLGAKLVVNQPG